MMIGRLEKVGALAWNGDLLASASREGVVLQHDIRTPSRVARRLVGHEEEVSRKWFVKD
jgi:cell division cycle 20-like protein 1 (cofactor of APC complex)